MFSFLYNSLLFLLGLCALPKMFRRKTRSGLGQRLGRGLPDLPNKQGKVVWIHAVSVGETRAAAPLFHKMRAELPEATFIVSSVTETGHHEAKRSLSQANAHFFLPLDFSWIMHKVVHKYKPDLLLLVEGDFWYHLMQETKKRGGRVVLVNGKLSERSFKRFAYVKRFAKRLFSQLDLLCVQSERFKERFLQLGVRNVIVTGNLKLDISPPCLVDKEYWQQELTIFPGDRVLVIGSTHHPEEELLLETLTPVLECIPELKILLVPRHPERFASVAKSLERFQNKRIILVDRMGLLSTCYQLAELAIVGGSFTDRIGGHNVFEPIACGTPVLFGPHMHAQRDLAELVLQGGAGKQVTLQELPHAVIELLENKQTTLAAQRLAQEVHGVTEKTWKALFSFL